MKYSQILSLLILFLLSACETENNIDSALNEESIFTYNTSQQVTSVESFIIDFESYEVGDIVSEILITDPFESVEVVGVTMTHGSSNAALIFDSSKPSGEDYDLGTPNQIHGGPGIGNGGDSNDTALGNVLILSEDLDPTDPDDIFELGANFLFDFSSNESVVLNSFDILDIEESSNPTRVILYDLQENILLSKEIIPGGDNSKANIDLENTSNVAFMEIIMNSSGAIDNIGFDIETEENCVTCDSAITELTFKYIGNQPVAVRIENADGDVIFNDTIEFDEEFTVNGNDSDGTFGSNIVVFVENESVGSIITDCSQVIGPGFFIDDFEITSGITQTGGQLCPVQTTS